MENYAVMRERHQKKYNDFKGIGFAFSNEQFTKMCEKLDIKESESKEKLYSIGMGGYILKTRSKAFHQMTVSNYDEHNEAMKNEDFVYSAFRYELGNHEYVITYDVEPTLEALSMTVDSVNGNKMWLAQLNKAIKDTEEAYKDFK